MQEIMQISVQFMTWLAEVPCSFKYHILHLNAICPADWGPLQGVPRFLPYNRWAAYQAYFNPNLEKHASLDHKQFVVSCPSDLFTHVKMLYAGPAH